MDMEYSMSTLILFLMWREHNENKDKSEKKSWFEWIFD